MHGMTNEVSVNHEFDDVVNAAGAAPGEGASDDVVVDRPDDDDYDLLTFGEAGARLTEEVIRQQRRLDGLRVAGAGDDQVAAAEQRLHLLQQAQERNRKPPLEEMRDSGFFGPRE